MISLEKFCIGYAGKILLKDVELSFSPGKLTALIGRNGSGKSTLLKALCGLNDKYSGKIFIEGEDIKKMSVTRLAKLIAYVNTQRPRITNFKCIDVVALGRSPYTGWHGNISDKDLDIINKAIETVGMKGFEDRAFNSLSDGETQKIMIARAIAQDTDIIIMDEPTSFLDIPTRHEIVSLLKNLTEKGKTIIFSTHELDIALKKADYMALIDKGGIMNLSTKDSETKSKLLQVFQID